MQLHLTKHLASTRLLEVEPKSPKAISESRVKGLYVLVERKHVLECLKEL